MKLMEGPNPRGLFWGGVKGSLCSIHMLWALSSSLPAWSGRVWSLLLHSQPETCPCQEVQQSTSHYINWIGNAKSNQFIWIIQGEKHSWNLCKSGKTHQELERKKPTLDEIVHTHIMMLNLCSQLFMTASEILICTNIYFYLSSSKM